MLDNRLNFVEGQSEWVGEPVRVGDTPAERIAALCSSAIEQL